MPPMYAFPYDADVWLPFRLDPSDQTHDFAVWGRLRRGVTPAQARADLDATAAQIRADIPGTLPGYSLEMMTMRENVTGTQDGPLRALSAIVAFLLLIACINVSTLSLARAVTRRREFALRAALGATTARHVRQLFIESLALASCGCLLGLILMTWMAPLMGQLIPSVFSEQLGLATLHTDWRVATFALVVSMVSAIAAGVAPALGSSRTDPRAALSEGGRSIGGGGGRRLFAALVIAETALTLTLIAGAALVVQNFLRLQSMPLGFEAHGLLAFELTPAAERYPAGAVRANLIGRIAAETSAIPGVIRAAVTTVNPLGGGTWGAPVITERAAALDPNAAVNVNHRLVTPGLFETMGIRLLEGRTFTDQDRAGGQMVAIVSDRMARRLWPNQDPIGQRIRIARPNRSWLTVIGIAADVSDSHDPGVPRETWYVPYDQHAETAAAEHIYLMAKSRGDAIALVPSVRRAIARIDATLAPYKPVAMDQYRSDSIGRERLSAAFILALGAFGLLLAALGVYGVMAFSVAQRTAEFGVRLALGARLTDILPLVLRRSAALVGAGLALGAGVAIALNRALASVLTEVSPFDLASLAGAALCIAVTAGIACLVPALAAGRLDPIQALKID
jgi:putative ABC transport system permease protein